jgi:uncharacterized protein (DUF427 family)
MKAVWNGVVIAESDRTLTVEGNHYFPPDSVRGEYLESSGTHTTCPWKGMASYFNIVVAGRTNPDAAWYYPEPKPAAHDIRDYVAFWKGVDII